MEKTLEYIDTLVEEYGLEKAKEEFINSSMEDLDNFAKSNLLFAWSKNSPNISAGNKFLFSLILSKIILNNSLSIPLVSLL